MGNHRIEDSKPTLRFARGKELPPERPPVLQRPEDLLGHRRVLHHDATRGRPRGARGGVGGGRGGAGPIVSVAR